MRKTLFCILIAASLSAQAGNGRLLPARGDDQIPSQLLAAPLPAGEFERKPVAFSWALDPSAALTTQAPYQAESREYWLQVEGSELTRGYALETSAPGAVIRISPIGTATEVATDRLQLARNGAMVARSASFAHVAGDKALQQSGMDVSRGTAVVQLDPRLGKGRFTLSLGEAKGRYLLHVYEPDSPYALSVGTDRAHALAGSALAVSASLGDGKSPVRNTQVSGLIVAPDGHSYDMRFQMGRDGVARATTSLPTQASSQPGLWEVQVFAGGRSADGTIQRDTRTAIAVAQPTARLDGGYAFDATALRFNLPVQVAATGRYELRGTLYATARDGIARPVAEAHSAAWFEPGRGELALGFQRSQLPAGYGAPFELRDVELNDQARMGKLETRELAAREAGQ